MWRCLRPLGATITGALVALVLAYLGAIVLIVARMGIPLGAEPRAPVPGEYLGLLLIAGGAAAIGGHIAAGMAHHHTRAVVTVLAVVLAGGALWSFTGAGSQWPAWWAPMLAAASGVGAWVGGTILRPRGTPARPLH